MPQDHRIQQHRFELKYRVPRQLVGALRDFVSGHLEMDDYSACRPEFAYPVHSVYLDSAGLDTYHATRNGDKNRFKLRFRYYDDRPDSPVFFEIKQRVDNAMLKRRCAVRRAVAPRLVAGQLPGDDDLITREPRHLAAIHRFHELRLRLDASPRLHNSYLREAWVSSRDNSVRVTFDQHIRAEPYFGARTVVAMRRPVTLFPEFVVVEVKFTNRYPNWLREFVEHFNLMRSTASKYCGGVECWGEHCFHPGSPDFERQDIANVPGGAAVGTTA
jgi:hypothetical protein